MKPKMTAVQISAYARPKPGSKDRWTSAACDITKVLTVSSEVPTPKFRPGKGEMIIKSLATAVDPGSWRMANGSIDFIRYPKSFPYIPGHDVSGIVEVCDPDSGFKKGDRVVCTGTREPISLAMAEYAVVETKTSAFLPEGVTPEEGAAIASAGLHAMQFVRNSNVKKGDRVLVIGGGGGIGLFILQFIRNAGASYVVLTSSHWKVEDLKDFGVDRVIDPHTENWWEIPEFKENKFNKIFDCGQGYPAWKKCGKVLKSGWNGGLFVSVTLDDNEVHMHNIFPMFGTMGQILLRGMWTRLMPFYPRYQGPLLGRTRADLEEVLDLCSKGAIKVVMDPADPLPFTTEGVCTAFAKMGSRHAHGKVVIKIDV